MANRDVLAIGTSAGGFDALRFLAASFPADFPAVILVTIHLSSHFPSSLDTILSAAGRLMACFPADGEAATPGRIYIAPPERHLIFDGDRLWLGTGPRENHSRPAIDPMFRSVAACCGARAVGAVLTGTLGDGASGLWALKQSGGESVVQDPKDAAYSEMPMSALNRVHPDHVVSLAELPALLERLAREPAGKPIMPPARLKYEVEVARSGRASMNEMDRIGRRSVLACPDCNGVMWEIDEGDLVRYRCHTGHAYTAEPMAVALDESLRHALASALRVVEERVVLTESLRAQAAERGRRHLTEIWTRQRRELEVEAEVIRDAIVRINAILAEPASKLRPGD